MDEDAAPIVRRIFNGVIHGKTVTKIADELTAENVLIPTAHWQKVNAGMRSATDANPTRWSAGSVIPEKDWREEQKRLLAERYDHVEAYYKLREDVRSVEVLRRGAESLTTIIILLDGYNTAPVRSKVHNIFRSYQKAEYHDCPVGLTRLHGTRLCRRKSGKRTNDGKCISPFCRRRFH